MKEQATPQMYQSPPTSRKERLKQIALQFLTAMETSGNVPAMFRGIFPALMPLGLSSLDKLTEEQAAELVETFRGYLEYIDKGEFHVSDSSKQYSV